MLPLGALVAAMLTALVLAAQAGLAFCDARVAIPIPDAGMASMPGMAAMPTVTAGGHVLMICPVVLVLIASSALLAALALVLIWRDPHRGLARRGLLRVLAGLPPVRTAGALAGLGAVAVAAMLAVDRSAPPALPSCGLLALLLAASSIGAVVLSIAAGRLALALGRRLILAVAATLRLPQRSGALRASRPVPCVCGMRNVSLLAARRGLRAPPRFVR